MQPDGFTRLPGPPVVKKWFGSTSPKFPRRMLEPFSAPSLQGGSPWLSAAETSGFCSETIPSCWWLFAWFFPWFFCWILFFETSSFRGRWSYFDENTRACLVWLVELQVTKEWTGPRQVCSNAGSKKKHFKAVDHVLWEFCTTPHCNFECSNVLDMVGFWENMDFSSRNSRLLIFEPCTASLVMSCTLMHFRHGDQRGFSRWKSQ